MKKAEQTREAVRASGEHSERRERENNYWLGRTSGRRSCGSTMAVLGAMMNKRMLKGLHVAILATHGVQEAGVAQELSRLRVGWRWCQDQPPSRFQWPGRWAGSAVRPYDAGPLALPRPSLPGHPAPVPIALLTRFCRSAVQSLPSSSPRLLASRSGLLHGVEPDFHLLSWPTTDRTED